MGSGISIHNINGSSAGAGISYGQSQSQHNNANPVQSSDSNGMRDNDDGMEITFQNKEFVILLEMKFSSLFT
jgi:hypothetical protein